MKKYILLFSLFLSTPALAGCPETTEISPGLYEAMCTARRVKDVHGNVVGFLYSVFLDITPATGQKSAAEQFIRWIQIDNAAIAGFEAAGSQLFDEPFTYDWKGDDVVFNYYWHLPNDNVVAD